MYKESMDVVMKEIENALKLVNEDDVKFLVDELLTADRVFMVGVGRVMISLQAFAKRLVHLGIDAHCVGDITEPAATDKSVLLVGSGSGCSIVPVAIAKRAKELNVKVIHIGSNIKGDMSMYADRMIRIPVQTKLHLDDEINSIQPMTSLFEQVLFLFGDIIAMEIIAKNGLKIRELWMHHANLE